MATGYSQEWSARNSVYTACFRIHYSTTFDAATNTSTVTITPQLKTSADFGNDYRVFNGSGLSGAGVYANGECVYAFGSNYGEGNYLSCGSAHSYYRDLGSWSFTVSHDAGGDASFTVGIYGSVLAMYFSGTGYTYAQCFIGSVGDTASATITIHENAASTIASSSSSVTTQGKYELTMTRTAATNKHIATFKYGSTTLCTSAKFDTSLSYTVPRSWFQNYGTRTSLPVTVSVQTYNSAGSAVGSPVTASVTVKADSGMKPTVSSGWATLAPYNTGAVANITGYVQGYSRAQATFTASKVSMTNAVGASIASYSVTCQGETDSASPYRTPVLASTSVSVVCKVTDTRGRSASETFTLSVLAYSKPKLSKVGIFRCTAGGAASEDGTKYSAKATLTYSSLNSQNTATLVCAVAAAGGSYGSAESLTSGTARISTANLSADRSYTVRIKATDALGNTAVYYQVLPTRKWAMKFRPTGNGAAFGKAAEYDHTFEVTGDWSVKFGQPLPVDSGGTGGASRTAAALNLGALDLYEGTVIPENADLNDYTTPGVYYCQTASIAGTLTNAPAGNAFKLIVGRTVLSTRFFQIAILNVSGPVIWKRYNNGSWSAWVRSFAEGADAAAARSQLGAAAAPTVVVKNGTLSGSTYGNSTEYTVSGDGTVIVYAGVYSADASDYGSWRAEIYYDGTLIMGEGSRLTAAQAERFGASTSVPIAVTNGKKIKITLYNSKGGTKNLYRRFLCFGCTVS